MKSRFLVLAFLSVCSVLAACAPAPPKHTRLSAETTAAMKGQTLAVVVEPKAEFTRNIKKQNFVVPGG